MSDVVREFNEYRQKMNERVLATDMRIVQDLVDRAVSPRPPLTRVCASTF